MSLRVLETLSVKDLIQSWRQDLGIDVSVLFAGIDHLELVEDTQTGQMTFLPPVPGDAYFYQELRRFDWYHPKAKLEHERAATYVGQSDFVLDVGAGRGQFAGYVRGAEYLGLETDPAAVESARSQGINCKSISMSDYRVSDEFRPANIVSAFQVLEHVAKPAGFLADMVSCAAPGAAIVIGVPNADSYVKALPDFVLNMPPHHLSWWTKDSLTDLMMRAGLEIEAVHHFPVEPWERQLWWMSKLAGLGRDIETKRFGGALRPRKILSFAVAYPFQFLPRVSSAFGSTLLVVGRKEM